MYAIFMFVGFKDITQVIRRRRAFMSYDYSKISPEIYGFTLNLRCTAANELPLGIMHGLELSDTFRDYLLVISKIKAN